MGRREDNKRAKRASLIDAGRWAFAHDGYDRATIEHIAREAGVARGTFYLYFPDKLAILKAITQPWVDDLVALVPGVRAGLESATSPEAVVAHYQSMGMGIAMVGLANRDAVLIAFREHRRSGEAGDYLRSQEARILDAFVALSERASELGWITVRDPKLTVRVVFGAVERLYFDVLTGVDLGDTEALSVEVVRLFTSSMGLPTP